MIYIYNYIIEQIRHELTELQTKGASIDDSVINTHTESIILEYLGVLQDNIQIFQGVIDQAVIDRINNISAPLIEMIFPFTSSKPSIRDSLARVAQLSIFNCSPINSSGIVIAGFGELDIFPSVITYEIYGVFNNQLLYRIREDKTIGDID